MRRKGNVKGYTIGWQLWANAVVPWSVVLDDDLYANYAADTDEKVGLSIDDLRTVGAAMKQIQDKTCIKFKFMEKPVKGQPWLFISRDNRGSDRSCQIAYIKSNLVGENINGLGDIYAIMKHLPDNYCYSGAYALYGSASPQNFVISNITLSPNSQSDIGVVIHELLHNLGLGHTQKRQDASEHIDIQWANIKGYKREQYEEACSANDTSCKIKSQYNTYGTEYDCKSILHYRDTFFITPEAKKMGRKTMLAKKAGCDLSSPTNTLRNSDIDLLKKIYCGKH